MIYKVIITGAIYSKDYYLFEASNFLKAVEMAEKKARECVREFRTRPSVISVELVGELDGRENTGRKRA